MKNLLTILIISCTSIFVSAQEFNVASPDGNIKLIIDIKDNIQWKALYKGNEVISKVSIGIDFTSGQSYGKNARILNSKTISNKSTIIPGVPHKDASINDEYNELSIDFEGNYSLKFRSYNDGVAYRFIDGRSEPREVIHEQMSLNLPNGTRSLFPKEESMYSHNERAYLNRSLDSISGQFCSLPVMFMTNHAKVLYTETALNTYPGMFLKSTDNGTLEATYPKYILKLHDLERRPDRTEVFDEEANYIAKISGTKNYPWRVFIISDDDRTFVESNLTYQMANPQVIGDAKWIKPGKVAWDWYNANNIYGVDFKSGVNTATYKYFIDFAAKNKLEYIIIDEGWTKTTTNLLEMNPEIDIKELVNYGKKKGVGVILWVLWKPLDQKADEILDLYKSWGVKGIKVDFMQRNDQYMVDYYERIAKKTAERQLMVDFHGSFKPSGLRRMYPNVVNYEGVKGNENHKWSKEITPEHNVTLPYIRMVAGPMDYTPGAMINEHERYHSINFNRPVAIGTRAHQVAMYVVYEAPLQMLCENPSIYHKEQATVDFISQIPTTWDETKVLHGKVGDYIVIARRKGDKWYIGAMTDGSARDFELDMSFLDSNEYTMQSFKDGINVDMFAQDFKIEKSKVNNTSKVNIKLAKGGGWSAIISKAKGKKKTK